MPPLKYERMDPITHIHKRTDMYIGSPMSASQPSEIVLNDGRIVRMADPVYSEGLLRILIEPLSNMIDNVRRSSEMGVRCSRMEIEVMDDGVVRMWNDGVGIPTGVGEDGAPIPQMIFGTLLTSSNYDDGEARFTSGRNGLGVKLTNVFSRWFEVEIGSPGEVYSQRWEDHMRVEKPPVIRRKKNAKTYTMVRFLPDYAFFGDETMSSTIRLLLERISHDTAAVAGIPVVWNGEKIVYKSPRDYITQRATINKGEIVHFTISLASEQRVDVVLASMPISDNIIMAFSNGIYNRDGGVHVDAVSSELFRRILARLGKKYGDLTQKDLRPGMLVCVSAWLINPSFTSQNKTRLASPSFTATIDDKIITTICTKWPMYRRRLDEVVAEKAEKSMRKAENKKRSAVVRIDNLDSANLAGSKRSSECTLILCEGLSAKTYAVTGLKTGWDGRRGRDYFGIYPIRGKLLNVRNASASGVAQNKEITDLVRALNLRRGVDYRDDEAFRTLSYGRIMIITDSDVDGLHIASLIINAVHVLFPTLTLRTEPFVFWMMTPVAKIYLGQREVRTYYTDHEYQADLVETEAVKNRRIKYFKGLGTCTNDEVLETFGQKVVSFVWDDKAGDALTKAFSSSQSSERKKWIEAFAGPEGSIVPDVSYTVTQFIDQELIRFSIDDCRRSIPSLWDGLKESQRKILFAMFKKNLKEKSMKVAQFGGYVAEVSNYHHGEENLYDTVTKMAQDFVGTNNIPLFVRDGQFGCLDPSTPVLTWDRGILSADQIRIGDTLVGDDGRPRRVLSTCCGVDSMFEIDMIDTGDSYKVNSEHILTVHDSRTGHTVDVPIRDLDPSVHFGLCCGSVIGWQYAETRIDPLDAGRMIGNGSTLHNINDFILNSGSVREQLLNGIMEAHPVDPAAEGIVRFVNRTLGRDKAVSRLIVRPVGRGPFVGWAVDGNERFLLGNLVVTHNSRSYNGKDAANARYIHTRMEPITRLIFCPTDDALLENVIDDGDGVEPVHYAPIIPMILINGCTAGIGTGWSSFIPTFHPARLIRAVMSFLRNGSLPPSDDSTWEPWSRGFRGVIRRTGEEGRFVAEGIMDRPGTWSPPPGMKAGKKDFRVREIPVKESINKYKEFLEKMQEEKKIRAVRNFSTANDVCFLFEAVDGFTPNLQNMKLSSDILTTNMVVFNEHDRLERFGSAREMVRRFCEARLEIYVRRREWLINKTRRDLTILKNRRRFITEVNENKIVIFRVPHEEVEARLRSRGYDEQEGGGYAYLTEMRITQFFEKNWARLGAMIERLENALRVLTAASPKDLWVWDIVAFIDAYAGIYEDGSSLRDEFSAAAAPAESGMAISGWSEDI